MGVPDGEVAKVDPMGAWQEEQIQQAPWIDPPRAVTTLPSRMGREHKTQASPSPALPPPPLISAQSAHSGFPSGLSKYSPSMGQVHTEHPKQRAWCGPDGVLSTFSLPNRLPHVPHKLDSSGLFPPPPPPLGGMQTAHTGRIPDSVFNGPSYSPSRAVSVKVPPENGPPHAVHRKHSLHHPLSSARIFSPPSRVPHPPHTSPTPASDIATPTRTVNP